MEGAMPATTIVMPKMGYDMAEGKIVNWLKKVGDQVQKGEAIAEIETEKVNIQIEAFASGVLQKIIAQEGDTVPVGAAIAELGTEGEEAPAQAEAVAADTAAPPADQQTAQPEEEALEVGDETREPAEAMPDQHIGAGEGAEAAPASVEITAPGGVERPPESPDLGERVSEEPRAGAQEPREEAERVKASPVARRIAEEQGVELSQVQGTGPGGRITKEDVERFLTEAAGRRQAPRRAAPRPAPAPQEAPAGEAPARREEAAPAAEAPAPGPSGVPARTRDLSRMGQAIARRMSDSKRNVPHFYATVEVDMATVMNLRQELNRALSEERKISLNDFVMKAAALAVSQVPILNSSFGEGGKVHQYDEINVAMAIALEQGLIAPVIKNCDHKPLAQIAREAKELVQGAKEGTLRQDEYEGATFTVSNMGMLGVDEFAAIINPPQAAILAVGAIAARPVVRDGALAVSQTMRATISVDHRVANGADGARFLQEFQRMLEDPLRLVL